LLSGLFDGGGSGGGVSSGVDSLLPSMKNLVASTMIDLGRIPVAMKLIPKGDNVVATDKWLSEVGAEMSDGLKKHVVKPVQETFENLFEELAMGIKSFTDLTWGDIGALAQGVGDMVGDLANTINMFYDNQIERIEQKYAAQEKSIRKNIKDEEKRSSAIIALERKKENEINKARRKQAIAAKANAVFQSIVNGLVGISAALAQGNPILAGVIATLAAANTAAIASQPLPALAKGVGEYPGASFNPEVISPLDKLKGYIKDSMGSITVQLQGGWRVSGYDFETVLEGVRESRSRLNA